VGIFPEGENPRGDHGLGRLVGIRFPDLPNPKKKFQRLRVFTGMLLSLTL